MKKMFFLAATAALALSSCTSDEIVQAPEVNGAEDGAVVFSAYSGRETRAFTKDNALTDKLAGDGFGVYAYEQGTTAWDTYRANNTVPNFFYNQKVAGAFSQATFKANLSEEEYTAFTSACTEHATYYSSEAGHAALSAISTAITDEAVYDALPDAVKKFATVTISSSNWTYAPIKYFSNNTGALHSFFAYAPYSPSAKVVFSPEGPTIRYNAVEDYDLLWAEPTTDKPKGTLTTGQVISFQFQHALSKISFQAGTFVDAVHGDHTTPGLSPVAEGTTVKLRSVKFVGNVPSQGRLSLTNGTWTVEASEEGAYEFCPAAGVTFNKDVEGYTTVSSDNMVIPTTAATEVKIQVVYDVITTDETNPKNSSTVTNVITSVPITLTAGKSYAYKLDLGLTSVKFSAEVDTWGGDVNQTIDLPNNEND